MTKSSTLVRALVGSVAILSSVVLGVTVTDIHAASKTNFNKQQCKIVDGNVKPLAIQEAGSVECVCPSASSANLEDKRRPTGAASTEDCFIQTPQQITNFNLPTVTTNPPDNPPDNPPGALGNPGNEPGVNALALGTKEPGKAGEDPPGGTGGHSGGTPQGDPGQAFGKSTP